MLKFVALLSLLFVNCQVQAQSDQYVKEREMLLLLKQDTVAEDLGLGEEVREQVGDLINQAVDSSRGGSQGEVFVNAFGKANKLLSKEQQSRLYQIWLQLADISVLYNEKQVLDALKLDGQTRAKIAAVVEKHKELVPQMEPELRSLFESGDMDELKSKLLKFKQNGEKEAMKQLSEEQRKALAEMRGKKVKFDPFLGQFDNF